MSQLRPGALREQVPERVAEVAATFGLKPSEALAPAIAKMMRELGLPASLAELGYRANDLTRLAGAAHASHFNLSAPFHPSASEYAAMIANSLA